MYPIFKRLADVLLSLLVLLLLLPLLLPIIVLLRLSGEGYVFYFQKRIGLHNKPFSIWKFATMLKDSPNIGPGTITLRNDPRLTPMGGVLRKTKINELPQIINVLKGDMSWVGPRPLDDRAFKAYPEEVRNNIYNVTPGITGIGSVLFRDEEQIISNSKLPPREFYAIHIAPYKGALELWYQQHRSFSIDLKIMILTAWVVIFPDSDLPHRWLKGLPEKPAIFKSA